MKWRVIGTDSESLSGVAPECPKAGPLHRLDGYGVYDCCPGPHLECGNEVAAQAVVAILNAMNVEICE